jgi:hypothetical protein
MIRTPRGDIEIEKLRVGDHVVTSKGVERRIKWLGHSTVDCRRYAEQRVVMPVRVAAGAFGPGKPEQDLFLSPGHAICVSVLDEVLIPVSALINGTTLKQVDVEEVTYWHLELESHDIVLANGLPTESYVDLGNRIFFAPAAEEALPHRRDELSSLYCRPFVTEEVLVQAVRARLRARAYDLGWCLETTQLADVTVIVDGKTVRPDIVDELALQFVLPAAATDVWLSSEVSVPAGISDSSDSRTLGLCISRLIVDDGWNTRRNISSNDPRLSRGFHSPEGSDDQPKRWTEARAHLPAALWEGCRGHFFLRVELFSHTLPRWKAPQYPARSAAERRRPRLVAS